MCAPAMGLPEKVQQVGCTRMFLACAIGKVHLKVEAEQMPEPPHMMATVLTDENLRTGCCSLAASHIVDDPAGVEYVRSNDVCTDWAGQRELFERILVDRRSSHDMDIARARKHHTRPNLACGPHCVW